ncbi:MAG: hypothetical protein Fur007_11090 [Rhodoferax sp.]
MEPPLARAWLEDAGLPWLLVAVLSVMLVWAWLALRRMRCAVRQHHQLQRAHVAQEAQREQLLQRLEKLVARVPGVVYQYVLHPDGRSAFVYASATIAQIYRVSPEQVRDDASAVLAVLHPEDRDRVWASIQTSAQQLTPWQLEYRVRFDDGCVRWLYGNALPERLDDGSVQWYGFITDITARRQAENRLRQLWRTVEQAPMAIVITDLQGSIEYANPSFTQVTGYTLDDVLGRNPRLLQSGQTAPEVYASLWQTVSAGQVWQGELINRKKTGEIFVEQALIAPVLDAQGLATHYVALKEDVTERQRADQRLRASLREKIALLNEVHHRVKNNLQVITSLLRLQAAQADSAPVRAVLTEMQGRIHSMALLHESLYRAGSFAFVDLEAYLRQLASQVWRSQASTLGPVRLQLALQPLQVPLELATPCALLVNELLSNACKHAFAPGQGGRVLLRLHPMPTDDPSPIGPCAAPIPAGATDASRPPAPQGTPWRLQVLDDGVGLPADWAQRSQTSLGLQLAHDLARQLGGALNSVPGLARAAADGDAGSAGYGAGFSVVFTARASA